MEGVIKTNVAVGVVMLANNRYRDEVINFAAAGTIPAGTILARAANGKMIAYVKGAVDATGVPLAVVGYDLTAEAAGDMPFRPIVAGEVRKERLIIAADGTSENVDNVVIDLLRDYAILALDCNQFGA